LEKGIIAAAVYRVVWGYMERHYLGDQKISILKWIFVKGLLCDLSCG
jgi:PII-like signaling protein